MTSLSRFFEGFKSGYRRQHAINEAKKPLPAGRQIKKSTSVIVICGVIGVLVLLAVFAPDMFFDPRTAGAGTVLLFVVFGLRILQSRRASK
jgi:hypothetical protein